MDATVTFILENIKQSVVYNAKLISGAEGDLKNLQNELQLMKCKLEDASKRQMKDEAFKAWKKQIQKVVYQVEDTIDAAHMIIRMSARKKLSLAKKVRNLRKFSVRAAFHSTALTDFATQEISEDQWRLKSQFLKNALRRQNFWNPPSGLLLALNWNARQTSPEENAGGKCNTNHRSQAKSFFDGVSQIRKTAQPNKKFFHNGKPTISFSTKEVQKLARPFSCALVDKFTHGINPSHSLSIQNFFKALKL